MAGRFSVHKAIQDINRPVFTTRELSATGGTSLASASQALGRLEKNGLVTRAARGIWCLPGDPRFSPFLLVPYLSGGHRAYVSFFSALHLHGMIEQIPQVVYAATTAHTMRRRTPVGTFSYHRISPAFFTGFDWYRGQPFLIGHREKALVDCLYLSSRKGRRFGSLPEVDLTTGFSRRKAWNWVEKIPYPKIRRHVHAKLANILGTSI